MLTNRPLLSPMKGRSTASAISPLSTVIAIAADSMPDHAYQAVQEAFDISADVDIETYDVFEDMQRSTCDAST
eukprot:SAG31_NODE_46009_length_256_cov_0.662420_1_plen_73_part_10